MHDQTSDWQCDASERLPGPTGRLSVAALCALHEAVIDRRLIEFGRLPDESYNQIDVWSCTCMVQLGPQWLSPVQWRENTPTRTPFLGN